MRRASIAGSLSAMSTASSQARASWSRAMPSLGPLRSVASIRNFSVGLHWDVWGEDERDFDLEDERAVRDQFARQLDAFHELMGRQPTHVDTHRHAHRKWNGA